MKAVHIKYTFILVIFSLIITCSKDEFCAEPTESTALCNFYTRSGSLLSDTTIHGFSVTGIVDYDSLLYDSASLRAFNLPFSARSDSCFFIMSFIIHDTLYVPDTVPIYYYEYDTLSFFYSPVLYYISKSCGFTYHYQVDSVETTNNIIDTIMINSGLITTKENENFKILL